MSFESEFLLVRLRARGSRLIIPTAFLALAAFLISFLNDKFSEDWQKYGLYGLAAAIALFGFVVPLIRYLTAWTDITTSRVVQRSGLFGQNFRAVSHANVERVELGSRVITLFVAGEEALEIASVPKAKLVATELSKLAGQNR